MNDGEQRACKVRSLSVKPSQHITLNALDSVSFRCVDEDAFGERLVRALFLRMNIWHNTEEEEEAVICHMYTTLQYSEVLSVSSSLLEYINVQRLQRLIRCGLNKPRSVQQGCEGDGNLKSWDS